jgi:putative transcription factor
MCGFQSENLRKAIVEGTFLQLCDKCIKFGEVVELKNPPKELVEKRLAITRTSRYASGQLAGFKGDEEVVVRNYAELVRRERERMGKTQEDVAKDLAEKVSVIQKIESGSIEPELKLAKKIEQYFKLSLIRKLEVSEEDLQELSKGSSLTIGDLIKIKK